MCGICGVIGPPASAVPDAIEAMVDGIAHRGPDDRGSWQHRFRSGRDERAIALGHARLSILDLSELGHQPMRSDDGRTVISYNGEIYNHLEIRADLEREGFEFRSECDTEVLLNAYRAWGIDALDRLNGMFALAIWDESRQRLLLARDRLGIKPLYYHFANDLLLFGSELGALRAHPAFSAEIDPVGLETYLRFGWLTDEDTIYRQTRRLPPGHLLIFERGELSVQSYWRVTDHGPRSTEPPLDFEGAVDELETVLGAAVEARMISDVPLGAFLSGGVDSSAIVALMQERSGRVVQTFSIGFEQAEFDEAPFARQVSEHLQTDHTELYVGAQAARDVLYELPTLYDEPFSDPSAIPTVLLSRMTREHVTVALSGDGGDELFGGYSRYAKLERLLPLMRLPGLLKQGLASIPESLLSASVHNGLRRLGQADSVAELAETFLQRFDDQMLRQALGREGSRPSTFCDVFEAAPTPEPLRRAMYAEARTYLNDDVLVKVDRASMSVGLEARVPLLDHSVVEFAFGLPFRLLTHGGVTKAPLRELLYRRVPRRLFERPKHGFSLPVRELLGPELEAWTERYLARERIAEEGLMDPDAVDRMLRWAQRPGARPAELWRLLCFERWFAVNHRGESV